MEGRAWKQVNGVTTLYLELDGIEWGTYDASGTRKERTIRASGTGGAVVAVQSPTDGLIRLLPNGQGSVIGWLRPDGKLGGAYTYDAYGNSPQAGGRRATVPLCRDAVRCRNRPVPYAVPGLRSPGWKVDAARSGWAGRWVEPVCLCRKLSADGG